MGEPGKDVRGLHRSGVRAAAADHACSSPRYSWSASSRNPSSRSLRQASKRFSRPCRIPSYADSRAHHSRNRRPRPRRLVLLLVGIVRQKRSTSAGSPTPPSIVLADRPRLELLHQGQSARTRRARLLEFLHRRRIAIFFKRIALVTTIVVLVMTIEYRACWRIIPRRQRPSAGSANSSPADLHLRRADVDGSRGRLRPDLRLARARDDQLLRAGRLHAPQHAPRSRPA